MGRGEKGVANSVCGYLHPFNQSFMHYVRRCYEYYCYCLYYYYYYYYHHHNCIIIINNSNQNKNIY